MTKYRMIANDIRNKILKGTYKMNEQLPFEKELCEVYGVSKMTVKKAMDILLTEGLIVKRRGAGTFVKDINLNMMSKLLASSQFEGFTAMHSLKKVNSKVLHYAVVDSDADTAERLNIDSGQFVYFIKRLRCIEQKPYVIEHIFMPISLIPGLKKEHLYGSVYEYIEHTLGLKIQSAHRSLTVRRGEQEETELLQLEPGDPVAVVKQTAFLENGESFEYSTAIHSYKDFEFETVLLR